jgi:SAM-dependent methyltransferase
MEHEQDLAGRAYWDAVWQRTGRHRVGQFAYFRYALGRVFDRYVTRDSLVCEVGCADSAWVPYFAQRGVAITGIDYSDTGIARLEATLAELGLRATLVSGDMLDPAFAYAPAQHMVFSLGLVEHFRDPRAILHPMRRLLRDDGCLITLVPNLVGAWGSLQQKVDADILAIHIRYSPAELDAAHAAAGFVPVEPARYFGIFGPLILNAPRLARRAPRLHRALTGLVWVLQQTVAWPVGLVLGRRGETRALASHIIGIYRKRLATDAG